MAIITVVAHVGLQLAAEKLAVASGGSPLTVKLTGWVKPPVKLAVIVLLTALPCVTVLAPPLNSEKLKTLTVTYLLKDPLGPAQLSQ